MKPKKVLLVYPHHNPPSIVLDPVYLLEPLAFEYIAAAMPEQEVQIIDLRVEKHFLKQLNNFKPDLVGFTGYSLHVNPIRSLASTVKQTLPNTVVMVGGHHATVHPSSFDTPEIDLIVMGEGCAAITEIMSGWGKWEGIRGLAYLCGSERVYNPPRPHPPLDDLPLPRRDLVEKYFKHYHYGWEEGAALVRTSLGCPFRCSFCALWSITGGKYIVRSIDSVIQEIKGLRAKVLFFADDETTIDYERMMRLANAIKKAGIEKSYYFWSRADTIISHPDLFKAWKEIGLTTVLVGLEAIDQERLNKFNKGLILKTQEKAIGILKGLGLMIEPHFIITPDYRKEDFENLGRYIRGNKLWKSSIQTLAPLPGTLLWDQYQDKLITRQWEYWDFAHLVTEPVIPISLFYEYLYKLYNSVMPLHIALFKYLPKYTLRRLLIRLWYSFKKGWRLKLRAGGT